MYLKHFVIIAVLGLLVFAIPIQQGHGLISGVSEFFDEQPNIYRIGNGVREFVQDPKDAQCTIPTFEIKDTDLVSNPTKKLAETEGNFFMFLNEHGTDSYRYLKAVMPEESGQPRYYGYVYDENNNQVTGFGIGLDSGSLVFGIETFGKDAVIDEEKRLYDFMEGKSKFEVLTKTVKQGDYRTNIVLYHYEQPRTEKKTCTIVIDWEFSVNEKGKFSTGDVQTKTGNLVDATAQLSPRQQSDLGMESFFIQCKEGYQKLSQKEHQFYDGRTACVTPETRDKLIERGWAKHETKSDFSLLERFKNLPEVVAFYETYDDVQVSVRMDHVSYSSGSDEGYFVRMNLVFDENHDIINVDFHCYYQRVHQYELPQEHIEQKIAKYDCKEHGETVETKLISETKTKDSQAIKKDLINFENISTMKPNSMELFYYPESPIHEPNTPIPRNADTYRLFMLIRLPEWMGGDANDASAYRAYNAKSLDDACIVKYWPDDGRQRIENPCQGGMYRVVDGAMTTGMIHRSTPMTALPYLDLSVDENGLLYAEPPRWTKTENGVIGYGREISFDDFRSGSEFLAESFANTYPDYPPIPLQFAGYDLSEIAPEQYRAKISYLDFPDNSGKILMEIGKYSVSTGYTYWTKSHSELFQLGDTAITVNKYVFEREDDTDNERLRTYEVRFKDDGFYYAINGKNVEFIKKEIVRNFFPEHEYNDMFLISKDSD